MMMRTAPPFPKSDGESRSSRAAAARRYSWRLRKWMQYAAGKSLHNVPQGVGRAYVPAAIEGYFNDLTGKTGWAGDCDPEIGRAHV